MSKFTDIFKRSTNQVNSIVTPQVANWLGWSFTHKKYADIYLYMVLNRILRGMKNVRFTADNVANDKTRNDIAGLCRFFENNITLLTWMLWTNGFIVVGEDRYKNRLFIPDMSKIRLDGDGRVMEYDDVVYSDLYVVSRRTDFDVIKENLSTIDTLKSADDYLTQSLGAFAIMSGKAMPISAADKEDFLDNIKAKYGITKDKYQILLMTHEVALHQLNLPIKDLDLSNKVKEELKAIAGYFGVPYDLIPFSGASTYANQEQAIKQFYSDCISPIAETMLSLLRYVVLHWYNIPSYQTTFIIDNVPELADDRMADVEYKLKVAELAQKVKDLGGDASPYIEELTKIEE